MLFSALIFLMTYPSLSFTALCLVPGPVRAAEGDLNASRICQISSDRKLTPSSQRICFDSEECPQEVTGRVA